MMIAAKLGIISHKPFSYMISNKNAVYYGEHDKKIKIENDKVIIITDVIVTGETVNNIINELDTKYNIKEESIEKILTIFRRQAIKIKDVKKKAMINYLSRIEDRIVSLNNEIDIELCLKEVCIFKENDICICENKRV